MRVELLVARNPDQDSTLPFLLRVPIGGGLVFRTKGTWPRTTALYCHPVPAQDWPAEPEIVETVALRSCQRRGAAIDVIADRAREQRSQSRVDFSIDLEEFVVDSSRARVGTEPGGSATHCCGR